MTVIPVTREVGELKINRLNKWRSPGPDEIYQRVLKECKEVVSERLAAVFRMSLDSNKIPVLWEQANVVPKFKKRDKTPSSNIDQPA